MTETIQMVDLHGQYLKLKPQIDAAIGEVIDTSAFINGPQVSRFATALGDYLDGCRVITCGNGTDALQIALMALGLQRGDEVIVPAFTYVASAEVIALLGLTPLLVDIDPRTFNIKVDDIRQIITPRTKAIIPVHLFGQCCDMEVILKIAAEYHLFVIEDNAQSLGATYTFSDGHSAKAGTMGTIGCTSFFPSKNLGCYGDGGALFTHDEALATRIRMIANHGQRVKYHHEVIGCNSRLDTVQAAILGVMLPHLDDYCAARRQAAHYYNDAIRAIDPEQRLLVTPSESPFSSHVYHQYTLLVKNGRRDALRAHLASCGVPSMIYYPLPLNRQEAFGGICRCPLPLTNSGRCAETVLSLPMHTELTHDIQDRIVESIKKGL